MNDVEMTLEEIGGKAQLSVTVPIPLYVWAKQHAPGGNVSGYITSLLKAAREQEQAQDAANVPD